MEFLEACSRFQYPDFEVIIVDNDPLENLEIPENILRDRYQYIVSQENPGFAAANNLGISKASGDYYFFLNNDTIPTPELLQICVQTFLDNPSIGALSPMILYADQKETIQYAGYTPISPWTGRNNSPGKGQKIQDRFLKPGPTAYLHGAAMMVRRDVVEKAGRIPEMYFLYYEELDWSVRILDKGYQIFFQPQARVYHKASLSVGNDSVLKAYYYHRNRILFMRRNTRGFSFVFFSFYTALVILPKYSLRFMITGKWKHLRAFWRGMVWHINNKTRHN